MKILTSFLVIVASLALSGCGADSNTTADQDAAFKKADKSAIKGPPPGAATPPANFKSSLSGESTHVPAGVTPGPTPGRTGG